MIQRFIELGEGYSDIYELIELAKANTHRIHHFFCFTSKKEDKHVASIAVCMKPTEQGEFVAIYVCREGIPNPTHKKSQRYQLFEQLAFTQNKQIITLDVKPSSMFAETALYYQYLIGVLRLNHYISPLK